MKVADMGALSAKPFCGSTRGEVEWFYKLKIKRELLTDSNGPFWGARQLIWKLVKSFSY